MTGRVNELGESGGGDDGFLSVALMPQFMDSDGAAVAANRKNGIIAYVESWRQIRL